MCFFLFVVICKVVLILSLGVRFLFVFRNFGESILDVLEMFGEVTMEMFKFFSFMKCFLIFEIFANFVSF